MFTVMAPSYTGKSAGVWMLHWLCDQLNRIGYPATLCVYTPPHHVRTDWLKGNGHKPGNIVWCPEVMTANPLGGPTVRYLLNREGVCNGGRKIDWQPSDYPVAYSKAFRDDCDVLFYPRADLELFRRGGAKRRETCWYRGKGILHGDCPPRDGIEITRDWPESREELASIFRRCHTFYTYDSCTSLSLDAALCGCIPHLLHAAPKPAELGCFWRTTYDDPDWTAFNALPRVVKAYQDSFQTTLRSVAESILKHFRQSPS